MIRGGFGIFVEPITIANLSVNGNYSTAPIIDQEGFSQETVMTPSTNNYLSPSATFSDPFPGGAIVKPNAAAVGPTTFLGKLHAHVTTLQPGAGYEPHVDAYDVAILTLSGTVETLGDRVGPDTVIYYAAGEAHGMRNVGSGVARYLVFEFHAPGLVAITGRPYYRRQAGRVLRAGKRFARAVLRRVSGG